ncbi:MAG: molybdopterin biosynthesis protein [Euryarchaeota archaeon]|nr:molybdopterin biosynthesis protein [Euryarchaeota archaeon]MBU4340951.1 molybdopterin biosynthesis protein [Euryarchaeota archaeon]
MQKEFRKLVTINDANRIIESLGISAGISEVKIQDASGLILAEDVFSEVDVPPFDRAAMDGFAVRASDTFKAREDRPVSLKLAGSILPGVNPDIQIKEGEAAEIATGAVMPAGADSVVMVEYTRMDRDVLVLRPVSINENVMHAGADIMAGERLLKKGTSLVSREIGLLAAAGRRTVKVNRLTAGLISTGNELVRPGDELQPGQIYDINSFSIGSAVKECGGEPVYFGIIKDERKEMESALKKAADACDIILTSGSTSAGTGDMMYRIIGDNGTLLAHGIDIKPGKPAIIGKVFGKPVFGLPGYPASSLTIFNEFIAPVIRKAIGKKQERLKVQAKIASRIRTDGRSQLLPVGLVRGLAYPIEKGSGAITTLSEADGFIEIPSETEMIEAGEGVEVTLFGEIETPELLFVGSHCLGLDVLADVAGLNMRVINTGSSGGLSAIRNGTADIAGVHLLDESGEYNMPFLERFGIKNAVLVKGYLREQGLIVRKDSGITGLEDILDMRFINRNTGSGTRVLVDLKLREIAAVKGISFEELVGSIEGYNTEAKTHSAVAAAVKLGKADAGVGIRTVAELNGLDFIKIADEEYDLVIPQELLESREISILLKALRGKEFSDKMPHGLRTYKRTGEIISGYGEVRKSRKYL